MCSQIDIDKHDKDKINQESNLRIDEVFHLRSFIDSQQNNQDWHKEGKKVVDVEVNDNR